MIASLRLNLHGTMSIECRWHRRPQVRPVIICEDQRLAKAAELAEFSVLELSRVVPGTLAIGRNS